MSLVISRYCGITLITRSTYLLIGELLKQSSKDNMCVSSNIAKLIHLHVQEFGTTTAQPS